MSDPYYEATRHARRGMPTWGKILLAFGALSAVALGVLVMVGVRLAGEFRDTLDVELAGDPSEVFADMTQNVLGGDVTIVTEGQPDGRLALRLGEDGDEIPVDLSNLGHFVEEGLALVQEGMGDGVRIEGRADESSLSFTVRGADGRTVFELEGDEEGGVLRVAGNDGELLLGLGDEAARAPDWLPVYRGARVDREIFSYDSGEARSGGFVMVVEGDPVEIRDWYVEELREADGPVRVRKTTDITRLGRYRARIDADDGTPGGTGVAIVILREARGDETTIMVVYREADERRRR